MPLLTQQRKRQQILIGVLGIVVLIIAALFWVTGDRSAQPSVTPTPDTGASIIPRVNIPEELFTDKTFLELSPYEPIELPETIGKDNPFNP